MMMELNSKNKQFKRSVKLSEFVEYQSAFDKKMKKKERVKDQSKTSSRASSEGSETKERKKSQFPQNNVDFCVNVDIGAWDEQMKELKKKIPEEFMCMSKHDILRFSRVNVLGVNTPQVYLKVRGNWTGGHQENLSLRALNINFGPASTIWHGIALPKDIEKFRELVLEKYKLDIKKQEGLWFCDIDFCLANNIPVITFNQRKGDLVLLGPSVLHWVRTLGLTT